MPEGVNWEATLTSGGIQVPSNIALTAGLNHGSTTTVQTGAQVLVVYDGYGNEVAWTENQRCVTSGCTDGIYK